MPMNELCKWSFVNGKRVNGPYYVINNTHTVYSLTDHFVLQAMNWLNATCLSLFLCSWNLLVLDNLSAFVRLKNRRTVYSVSDITNDVIFNVKCEGKSESEVFELEL